MSLDLSKLLGRQITGKKLQILIQEQTRKICKEQNILKELKSKNPKGFIIYYNSNHGELEELQIHCKKSSLEKWLKDIIKLYDLSV